VVNVFNNNVNNAKIILPNKCMKIKLNVKNVDIHIINRKMDYLIKKLHLENIKVKITKIFIKLIYNIVNGFIKIQINEICNFINI